MVTNKIKPHIKTSSVPLVETLYECVSARQAHLRCRRQMLTAFLALELVEASGLLSLHTLEFLIITRILNQTQRWTTNGC